jgi:hypothetical protein
MLEFFSKCGEKAYKHRPGFSQAPEKKIDNP